MDVGALVWVHDPADPLVWVPAQLLAVHRSSAGAAEVPTAVTVLLLESARQLDITLSYAPPSDSNSSGECRNVLLQNQPHELDQSDLVALPHLHEASILHALRLRYARDAIYTRIGEILISINPFKKLPALYTRDAVAAYAPDVDASASCSASSPPHLFAIARAAYVDVLRNGRNQSILISGESGAGKTEATKIMMKYFAETCGGSASAPAASSSAPAGSTFSIETQVLQSNPILEAFGNARTVRNDNSSRFGKFIELQFASSEPTASRRAIVGARIRTYLLEKIRVISQAPHERNFHVFYELIAAASATGTAPSAPPSIAAAAPAWRLRAASDFRILNQSGCFARRDGVEDAAQFARTHRAMQQIGLRDDEIVDAFSVVAALLHLGNVAFTERLQSSTATREALVAAGNEPFGTAASLLRVPAEQLAFALTKRTLTTATETLTVALDAAQAEHTRNALVMECYRLLFAWLVAQVNAKIHFADASVRVDCIGLLDIFGFEDMAVNSFEQLCINYANEALQHQFNEFVFDEEQKLYASEGIPWAFVDFPNNRLCLELFEKRPIGLFSLADQECLFPQGTDRALLAKLYAEFEKRAPHAHFAPPPSGWQRQSHFVVAHYAGRVSYAVDGFLAKNKDAFCETAAALLATSSSALVQGLSRAAPTASPDGPSATPSTPSTPVLARGKSTKSALQAASVGSQFKLQLNDLLDRIRATAPHYVRCIKPNDAAASERFQAPRALEQLRCGGVLEAVRVARAGFPVRMAHAQFLARYQRVLLFRAAASSSKPALERCLARLAELVPGAASSVSLGRTRVFFRREPYERVERLRVEIQSQAAVAIQKTQRGHGARHAFTRLRRAVLQLQSRLRGAAARECVRQLRRNASARLVQRHARRLIASRRYSRFRASVVALQTHWRRRVATRAAMALREARAALRLAAFWRCHHARRMYSKLRRAALALQCAHRRRQARRRLVALRLEARNVAKLQQDNLKLQTELATLRMAMLAMQAQSGSAAFPGFQIPIEPELASKLQLPKPSMLLRSLDKPEQAPESPQDNQPQEAGEDVEPAATASETVKPRSHLAVDLSRADSPSRVKLQAPHSVLPPSSSSSSGFRRSSMEPSSSSSSSSEMAASTTKAELFTQMQRRRSRSSQQLGTAGTQRWQNQQDALDAKVKQLREELKAAARSANPEEEQDEIVKRFVAAQLQQAALASPKPSPPLLQARHSGNFGLALPEECDNNSAVDEQQPQQEATSSAADPTAPMASTAHFKRRSSSNLSLPQPLTACAPHSRFAWGALPGGDREPMAMAPLSARPASHTGLASTGPRFFGDIEGSAWSSSVFGGSVTSLGSVPRWSKADQCRACACKFTFLTRRHHCRSCGQSFCFEHSTRRMLLTELGYADAQRVCDDCFEWRVLEASRASVVFGGAVPTTPLSLDAQRQLLLARQASSMSIASTAQHSDVAA